MRRNLKFFAVALLVGLLPAATAALAQSTCNLALNPPALILDANGGTGTIQVTAAPIQSGPVGGVSCPYTGYGSKPWIAVTGIITGSGQDLTSLSGIAPGAIKYSIQANNGPAALTGAIMISNNINTYVVPVLLRGTSRPQIFDDVPVAHPQYDHIALLSMLAVTRGCSAVPSVFCADAPTTRGQAAAFIIRSILGESFTYNQTPVFSDVPSTHPQFAYIQKMKELNYTNGCALAPARYCPEDPVLREQMAVFLTKARFVSYNPSPAAYFADVPGPGTATANPNFQFIQQLRESGITVGCSVNPPQFCPKDTVNRAQMAVFLIRAFFTN